MLQEVAIDLAKDAKGALIKEDGKYRMDFETNQFSIYALTYKDVKNVVPPKKDEDRPFVIPNTGVDAMSVALETTTYDYTALVYGASQITALLAAIIAKLKGKKK